MLYVSYNKINIPDPKIILLAGFLFLFFLLILIFSYLFRSMNFRPGHTISLMDSPILYTNITVSFFPYNYLIFFSLL